MSTRGDDPDGRAVRGAAVRTGLQVAGVSTAIVLAILVLAALFVIDQSRPSELIERPVRGEAKIYVDSGEVLAALVVLGLAAVVVVGFASWAISRRAVEPLGAALRTQRAFVADASHELRTPLAVLSSRLQVLHRQLDRGEPWEETLAGAKRDTTVMGDLVTDLLLLAEAAASEATAPIDGADLRPAIEGGVADLHLLARARDVHLEVEVSNEGRVGLTELSLRRAVTILVDNALAHAPDGSRVRVMASVERGRAVVLVRDEGPGIDERIRGRMFERFAHGEATGRPRGFGIGLSLVRDLAERAGGSVAIDSTSPVGTVMRLELPVHE